MIKNYKIYIFILFLLLLLLGIFYIGYRNKNIKKAVNGYYKLNVETNIKESSGSNF